MKRYVLILSLLSIADAVFTLLFLQRHPDGEANPAVAWAIPVLGSEWFVFLKGFGVGLCAVTLARFRPVWLRRLVLAYGVIVLYHLVLFIGGV